MVAHPLCVRLFVSTSAHTRGEHETHVERSVKGCMQTQRTPSLTQRLQRIGAAQPSAPHTFFRGRHAPLRKSSCWWAVMWQASSSPIAHGILVVSAVQRSASGEVVRLRKVAGEALSNKGAWIHLHISREGRHIPVRPRDCHRCSGRWILGWRCGVQLCGTLLFLADLTTTTVNKSLGQTMTKQLETKHPPGSSHHTAQNVTSSPRYTVSGKGRGDDLDL